MSHAKLDTPLSTRRTKPIYTLSRGTSPYIPYMRVPSLRMHRPYLHNLCGKHFQSTGAPRDCFRRKLYGIYNLILPAP